MFDGKAQAVSLPVIVVRILTENQNLHAVQWSQSKSVEDICFRWKNLMFGSFTGDEFLQVGEVRLLEFVRKSRLPAAGKLINHAATIHQRRYNLHSAA